jgi:membrane-bound lytic murein transglycosylase B
MSFDQWIAAHFPKLMGHVQLLPEVLEKDEQQAEFTLPIWDYIDRLSTAERMILGQKYFVELHSELNRIFDTYGVSHSLLLAIWGIETNFGKTSGTIPIGSALATLAFSGRARRRSYFTDQLQYFCSEIYPMQGEGQPICGSWAGASGHMQFMPETYAKFGVQYRSRGPANIWASIPDALMSAANYLAAEGLNEGDCLIKKHNIETDMGYSWDGINHAADATVWANRGLKIEDAKDGEKYFCVSPVGRHGSRILLGGQALALYQYNRSTNYVLAVSKLATMIDGGHVDWSWDRTARPLNRSEIMDLQSVLIDLGYNAGASDGIIGPDTVRAVMQAQTGLGIEADGYPDLELLARLRALIN